jgi:hypothetical protein
MRRDPATGAPDFFSYARYYLHVYMPRVRALSPKTIEAYRISLECFLGYLAETEHVHREHVCFDHFGRPHLKAWLAWMTDHRGYAPKTVTLRLSAVKAFLAYAAQEDITLFALSQAARALKGHDAAGHHQSHPRDQRPGHRTPHRRKAPGPLQSPVARSLSRGICQQARPEQAILRFSGLTSASA